MDDGLADLREFAAETVGPDLGILLDEGAEEADDREAVERLVADRPGDDLAHALELAEAREVQEDGEGGEELQALGEGAEGGQGLGDLVPVGDREALHVVVLVLHLLIFQEGRVLGLRHADRVEEMGVGGDVDRFDVGERGQHHQHFGGFEHLAVVLHVAVVHLDVGLGEEAENLGDQMLLALVEVAVPVLDVVGERHLLRQPVDTLLGVPRLVCPRVAERLVDRVLGQKVVAGGGDVGVHVVS